MEDSACSCTCHTHKPVEYASFSSGGCSRSETPPLGVVSSEPLIKNFTLYDTRKDHQTLITSVDWDQSGDYILSCCGQSAVTLHSLSKDTVRHLYSRKHGAHGGRFVHGGQTHCIVAAKPVLVTPPSATQTAATVLESLTCVPWDRIHQLRQWPSASSSREKQSSESIQITRDNVLYPSSTLRYWDLQENRFVKTFALPAPVGVNTQLSVSKPSKELICAPSVDGRVRFFTFQEDIPLAVAETDLVFTPQATLAPSGDLGAVQILPFTVQLLDFRKGWKNVKNHSFNIEAAVSLSHLNIDCSNFLAAHSAANWHQLYRITNLQIADAPYAALFITLTDQATRSTILHFDVHTGALLTVFQMPPSQDGHRFIEEWKIAEGRKEHPDFCFNFLPHVSSDGRHLACGSGPDNCIALWSIKKGGLPIKTLPTESRVARRVQWNPSQLLLASAYDHLAFWGPSYNAFNSDTFFYSEITE